MNRKASQIPIPSKQIGRGGDKGVTAKNLAMIRTNQMPKQPTKTLTGTTTITTNTGAPSSSGPPKNSEIRKAISDFLGTEFPTPKQVKKTDFWTIWDACFAKFPPGFQFAHDEKSIKEIFDLIGCPISFNPSDFSRIGDQSRFSNIFAPFKWIIELLQMYNDAKSLPSTEEEIAYRENLEKLYNCYDVFLTDGIEDKLITFVAQAYDQKMLEEAIELGEQVEGEKQNLERMEEQIQELQEKQVTAKANSDKNNELKNKLQNLQKQINELERTNAQVGYELQQKIEQSKQLEEGKMNAERLNIEARNKANSMKDKQESMKAARNQLDMLMKELNLEKQKHSELEKKIDENASEIQEYQDVVRGIYNDWNESLKNIRGAPSFQPSKDNPLSNIAKIEEFQKQLKTQFSANNSFTASPNQDRMNKKISDLEKQKQTLQKEIEELKKNKETQTKKPITKKGTAPKKEIDPQNKINDLQNKLTNAQQEEKQLEKQHKQEVKDAQQKLDTAQKAFQQYQSEVSAQLESLLEDVENTRDSM